MQDSGVPITNMKPITRIHLKFKKILGKLFLKTSGKFYETRAWRKTESPSEI